MMKTLSYLISRNCKVFFKDKGLFFPSLLAPLILLFLFIAFLGNVYRDSIRSVVTGFELTSAQVERIASGWLVSSLIAVCAVTIAFTASVIMVQDKANGQRADLYVTPVPRSLVALAYFLSTFLVTAIICLFALLAGFVYMGIAGWSLSFADLLRTVADMLLLILFGTALSSIVCRFLNSQGGVTAVQATVSAAYGFLCGAYMPLGNLVPWLKNLLMFLPGTYGTGLLHEHLMGGAIDALSKDGLPSALADGLKNGFDCTLSYFGNAVPEWTCYLVLAAADVALVGVFVLLCVARRKHTRRVPDLDK